jgi:glycosyltransferase involved in cell wall biosynthesis
MKTTPKISICIPTYNRSIFLDRCLQSIQSAYTNHPFSIEICIYDSSDIDECRNIVSQYSSVLNINYQHNPNNEGYAGNFKKCLLMANAKMVWFIGDDDLLVQNSLKVIDAMFLEFPQIDFFYCNAYKLDEKFIMNFPKPFDTKHLPLDMSKYTYVSESRLLPFRDLIDYRVSFDFLGGMFLSIFNKNMWEVNCSCVQEETSKSKVKFVDLDSTFPHSKIFAHTFMRSNAYLLSDPLIVAVSGVREWVDLYPFIRTFRLMDLLTEYKKNGLPHLVYWRNKNFTVKYFAYDALYSLRNRGGQFPKINVLSYLVSASIYPNFYLSFIRLLLFIIKKCIKQIINSFDRLSL